VCGAIARNDLLDDPRFASSALRARHQDALRETLEATFGNFDAADIIAKLAPLGVPCVPINSYSEAVEDPQVRSMGWVEPLTLPNGVKTRTLGFPLRFNGENPGIRLSPPRLGEHSGK
jgi:formyl-CoA transferase